MIKFKLDAMIITYVLSVNLWTYTNGSDNKRTFIYLFFVLSQFLVRSAWNISYPTFLTMKLNLIYSFYSVNKI